LSDFSNFRITPDDIEIGEKDHSLFINQARLFRVDIENYLDFLDELYEYYIKVKVKPPSRSPPPAPMKPAPTESAESAESAHLQTQSYRNRNWIDFNLWGDNIKYKSL